MPPSVANRCKTRGKSTTTSHCDPVGQHMLRACNARAGNRRCCVRGCHANAGATARRPNAPQHLGGVLMSQRNIVRPQPLGAAKQQLPASALRPASVLNFSANDQEITKNTLTGSKSRQHEADQSGTQTWLTGSKCSSWQRLWRLSPSVQAKGRRTTSCTQTFDNWAGQSTSASGVL